MGILSFSTQGKSNHLQDPFKEFGVKETPQTEKMYVGSTGYEEVNKLKKLQNEKIDEPNEDLLVREHKVNLRYGSSKGSL